MAKYPPEVDEWVSELRAVSETASRDHWMRRHPDGRRWVGYKAGVYLVDRSMQSTGRSVVELMSASTDDIVQAAGQPTRPAE